MRKQSAPTLKVAITVPALLDTAAMEHSVKVYT